MKQVDSFLSWDFLRENFETYPFAKFLDASKPREVTGRRMLFYGCVMSRFWECPIPCEVSWDLSLNIHMDDLKSPL